MKRKLATILLVALALTLVGGAAAQAHWCQDPEETDCETTPVAPDWREGNYIPLFDIDRDCGGEGEASCEDTVGHDSDGDGNIDGDDARYDAQRWRDECAEPTGEDNQFCVWADFGTSLFTDGEFDPEAEPNEVHAGTGGSHCFLFEFAHNCEDHYTGGSSEGAHDAHGGAIYADLCFAKNPESKWCDDGLEDTQVGLTVMDHNPCGLPVPVVACIDEYHVIRPFDQTYTAEQMDDSAEYTAWIAENPDTYVCGKEGYPDYTGGGCREIFGAFGF